MRNWCNNLTPNLSISPSWFLAQLRPLTRQKNPWTCTSWPDGRIISMGNQFSPSVMSDSLQPHGLQHARLPCPSPSPRVYSDSCPLSQWCHPSISSCIVPFSSHLHSFPASGSLPLSQFFTSGGQGIGVSASASGLPMNIQDWFLLELTGFISLQSKWFSRVFSNTTNISDSENRGATAKKQRTNAYQAGITDS